MSIDVRTERQNDDFVKALLSQSEAHLRETLADIGIGTEEAAGVLSEYKKMLTNSDQDTHIRAMAEKMRQILTVSRETTKVDLAVLSTEVQSYLLAGKYEYLKRVEGVYQQQHKKISQKIEDVKTAISIHEVDIADTTRQLKPGESAPVEVVKKLGAELKELLRQKKQLETNAQTLKEFGDGELKAEKRTASLLGEAIDFQIKCNFIDYAEIDLNGQINRANENRNLTSVKKASTYYFTEIDKLGIGIERATKQFSVRAKKLEAALKRNDPAERQATEVELLHLEDDRRRLIAGMKVMAQAGAKLDPIKDRIELIEEVVHAKLMDNPQADLRYQPSNDSHSEPEFGDIPLSGDFKEAMENWANTRDEKRDRPGIKTRILNGLGNMVGANSDSEPRIYSIDNTDGVINKNKLESVGRMVTRSPIKTAKTIKRAIAPKSRSPLIPSLPTSPNFPSDEQQNEAKPRRSATTNGKLENQTYAETSTPASVRQESEVLKNPILATKSLVKTGATTQTLNPISAMPEDQLKNTKVHDTLHGKPDMYVVVNPQTNGAGRLYYVKGVEGQFAKDELISITRKQQGNVVTCTMTRCEQKVSQEIAHVPKRGNSI